MECRLSSRKLFPLLSESKELNTRESLSKVGVPKIKSLTIFPQLEPFLVSGLHDLDLLDWFYNFLFSLFHLFIFFSLLWISSTLFSNPCVFHFCYILDFQSSFFFFWMLPLLKVFYYCFMDFFLFLKILMIAFEIVTFAKVLYPSSCFSPCSFVLYALL